MSVTIVTPAPATPEKVALAACNPGTLADHFRLINIAQILRGQMGQQLRRMVPASDPGAPSGTAVTTVVLPPDGKASRIHRVYARAGTSGTGEMTSDVGAYAAPASGHVAVQPNGDIAFLGSDAITDVDISYTPERGDVIVLPPLPVVSNSLAIPTQWTTSPSGVVLLLSCFNVTTPASPVQLRINKPAATNTTAGTASLDVAKQNVLFDSADAVTSAQVTLLVATATDLSTILESASTLL